MLKDGNISTCYRDCRNDLVIGHFRDVPMEKIGNSSIAKELRLACQRK
ncbi:MAG: hypothetical protein HY912_13070 [Desulfomonile tiedjei]|uniref:4Fe4S-binding SPASM domain-containing protein n=1 Tax=Desulfomonile tiedjei TaxID=2358 RepID=A0A9D6V224_9BACT|nr:hypothetical protein [Desulfomonile tiedjei]